MLAPKVPLQLLAQCEHREFDPLASSEERKETIAVWLRNCRIIADIGQAQISTDLDPILKEDVGQMRACALEAIKAGERALALVTDEDSNGAEGEFRTQYVNLTQSVKSFLWDAGTVSKRYLWPLVEEVM